MGRGKREEGRLKTAPAGKRYDDTTKLSVVCVERGWKICRDEYEKGSVLCGKSRSEHKGWGGPWEGHTAHLLSIGSHGVCSQLCLFKRKKKEPEMLRVDCIGCQSEVVPFFYLIYLSTTFHFQM